MLGLDELTHKYYDMQHIDNNTRRYSLWPSYWQSIASLIVGHHLVYVGVIPVYSYMDETLYINEIVVLMLRLEISKGNNVLS